MEFADEPDDLVLWSLLDLNNYELQLILQEVVDCGMGGMVIQVCHRFQKVLREYCRVEKAETRVKECVRWSGQRMWEYLMQHGCEGAKFVNYAAATGILECLKYAHKKGWHWDKGTCTYAAAYGHLACLKYAHEKECPWDEGTCAYAALNGHLECLKYAHDNDCPWDKWTCSFAALNGHLECLKYALEHGCPYDGTDSRIHALIESIKFQSGRP